jgi:K+-transporting ATPase ATPase A chain
VLLPFCLVGALVLVFRRVSFMNFKPYTQATLVEAQQITKTDSDTGAEMTDTVTDQTIAQGPVASQELIKDLGTNGGGFFNAKTRLIRLRTDSAVEFPGDCGDLLAGLGS